jgi:hypothetical protein
MTEMLKPAEGVTLDVDRFFGIVRAEQNLAPAFARALVVDRDLLERLDEAGKLTPEQDTWYNMESYLVDCEWPCPDFEIFEALGATNPERLLSFDWTGFGPMSWSRSSYFTFGFLGYDIAFSLDEAEGYPVQLLELAGGADFERAAAAAVLAELTGSESFGLPSRIENHVPGLISVEDVARAVGRRLEADDAWANLRALFVDEALYGSPVEMSLARLRTALSSIVPQTGESRPSESEGEEVPITEEDKVRLLVTYMERRYVER